MKQNSVKNLAFSALCLALAILLPQAFMRDPSLGQMFLPMHLPVLLCGLICGWQYGGVCGAAVPVLCSLLFSKPPLYPMAVAMMFELCAYGVVSGLLYKKRNVYLSLAGAMLAGRAVYGVANWILLASAGKSYTLGVFVTGAFVKGLPGIIVQFAVIPLLVFALAKAGLITGKKNKAYG